MCSKRAGPLIHWFEPRVALALIIPTIPLENVLIWLLPCKKKVLAVLKP